MNGPEFERLVKLDRLPHGAVTITADEAEREALARRFAIGPIAELRAELTVHSQGDAIGATGRLVARFEQRCAMSDRPFANRIDEPLAFRFVPALAAADEDEELEFASTDPDEIEYHGAAIDLGEAVAQSFGLALDPYATGPEADVVRSEAGIANEDAPSGPFAALAALRAKETD